MLKEICLESWENYVKFSSDHHPCVTTWIYKGPSRLCAVTMHTNRAAFRFPNSRTALDLFTTCMSLQLATDIPIHSRPVAVCKVTPFLPVHLFCSKAIYPESSDSFEFKNCGKILFSFLSNYSCNSLVWCIILKWNYFSRFKMENLAAAANDQHLALLYVRFLLITLLVLYKVILFSFINLLSVSCLRLLFYFF